ncbi:hypothetical protein INR49_019852, partial [Caranx melampygus]
MKVASQEVELVSLRDVLLGPGLSPSGPVDEREEKMLAVFSLLEPLLVFTTLQMSSLAASSLAMSTVDCGLRECLLG